MVCFGVFGYRVVGGGLGTFVREYRLCYSWVRFSEIIEFICRYIIMIFRYKFVVGSYVWFVLLKNILGVSRWLRF